MTTRPNGLWASLPVLLSAVALAWQAGASNLALSAQEPISSPAVALFRELEWRSIGPYLAGRTSSADATYTDPAVFYAAAGGGGLWKSTNDGHTWQPIFDAQPVGAVAVSPSRPDIVFLGTGDGLDRADGLVGDGLYRSADAGRTWTRAGLTNARAIARIAIAPDNPDRLLVAAVAAAGTTDAARGVFRSTDGGRTFTQALAADGLFGATELVIDPANPNTAYAMLAGMPGDGRPVATAGLFKSADAGATWRRIGDALPLTAHASDLSRVTLVIARARPNRLFLLLPAGADTMLYRSDDAGETWPIASPLGMPGSDPAGGRTAIAVHPANADEVYALGAGGSGLWTSPDGGRRFSLSASAGVEKAERLWIHPTRPHVMLAWGTGGPRVSVDAGLTWTSSFTLPTATVARVAVDTAFPYRACGVQARAWAFCVPTRTDMGTAPRRDWTPLPDAAGAIAPDPLDPDIVYAGQVTRYDRRTGQLTDVSPQGSGSTSAMAAGPLTFSLDGRMLYYGTNMLWRLTTATQTWTTISPDLTRAASTPGSAGNQVGTDAGSLAPRAGISAISVSASDGRSVWVGTADGLVQRTRDAGLTWANVTPGSLPPGAVVASIEVSHFDASSAYLVLRSAPASEPQILRTRDAGITWTSIAPGLPRVPVHAVREDAFRRGLLFAATDAGVQLSFDDGDSWQSLRLNMPATPVRDVLIKDADLVVATAGRGVWVLEDFSPMRQITSDVARADAFVFRPAMATRARRAAATDASSGEPSLSPAATGVALHYMIGPTAVEAVSLEVIESATGTILRRFASDADDPASRIPNTPGLHRVRWDLRTAPLAVPSTGASAAASLPGVVVMPGVYQVRLVAGSRVLRQAIIIRLDPRIRVASPDLQAQFVLAKSVQDKLRDLTAAWRAAQPGSPAASTLAGAAGALVDLSRLLDRADGRPSPSVQGAVTTALARADAAIAAAP